jgi:cation diffusion facilitator family transporter
VLLSCDMSDTQEHLTQKTSVALSSIFASVCMTGMKLVVGLMSGSIGILSEAAHSLLDMGAAIITYFAVRASGVPADAEHPYGHGKIESISALAETVLLFITSFWIIFEATKRLLHGGVEVEVTWYAFAVIIVSILIDYSRSRALMRVARETNSQALEADALHFQSDIWSSLVVLVGLVCVHFGYPGADAVAGLAVAIFVMKIGYDMGKRTFDVLIDTAPEGVENQVKDILDAVPHILTIERIRVRSMGPTLSIEALVTISRTHHTEDARDIIEGAEHAIRTHFPDADLVVHAKPIPDSSETLLETIHVLAKKEACFIHDVIIDTLEGKLFISYDLEVPAHHTLVQAHDIATRFEDRIRNEIGNDAEINTHLDPTHREVVESVPLHKEERERIVKSVLDIASSVQELHAIRNIQVREIAHRLIVTAHCSADKHLPLEVAHGYSDTLEHRILESNTRIARVLIHVEPE